MPCRPSNGTTRSSGANCRVDYARRHIASEQLGGLIDLIGSIAIGTDQARAKDVLGRVYEYFLGKCAAAEGKLGGEFFTPRSLVRLLVEMIEPYEGRVFAPCCGSGGMFVQSERFVAVHGGSKRDISIFGQESDPTTWRLAHMNLAIRGIKANLDLQPVDSFVRDLHPDLEADYILANPPLTTELQEQFAEADKLQNRYFRRSHIWKLDSEQLCAISRPICRPRKSPS